MYRGAIQMGTTHGISKYRLTEMFPYGVGCFMASREKNFVRGLKHLGLQGAEIIMMDGSKALGAAVEELEPCHVLCRKDFLATLNSAASGLKSNKRIKLTCNLRDALTGIYNEEKDLDQLIENMLVVCEDELQQENQKIKEKKEDVLGDDTKEFRVFQQHCSLY
eukprot:snap_masked-scaffold_7-processed-gene-14.28-mRNA-1 protein AED:1.00 eAED:1.00 QI:0/0/0/0/1/1/2/0/163